MITTNFERLPEEFLRVYERHLLAWAGDFAKYGNRIEIDLLRAPGSMIDLTALSHRVRLGARFWKHPVAGDRRITIAPLSERDCEIVAKHVEVLPRIIELRREFRERMARGPANHNQAAAGALN